MATARSKHPLISSQDVQGTRVYDPKGHKIGEIDHLMIDKVTGQVSYVVMTSRGFFGLGHSHYSLPWSALRYNIRLEAYETQLTEAQLKEAADRGEDISQLR